MYAYFNVTEYGGTGGKSGDTAEAKTHPQGTLCECPDERCRRQADSHLGGHEMAMKFAHTHLTLRPSLQEQVRCVASRAPADVRHFRNRPVSIGVAFSITATSMG